MVKNYPDRRGVSMKLPYSHNTVAFQFIYDISIMNMKKAAETMAMLNAQIRNVSMPISKAKISFIFYLPKSGENI